jgi:MinD-like ATPase involved in chromosome partitioning or flagellar assembly
MCARNLSEVADCFISKKNDRGLRPDKPEQAVEDGKRRGGSLVVFGHNTIYRSFFSCNLALEFSRQGHSVVAVDADPALPTVDFLIGESYPRAVLDSSQNRCVPGLDYSMCYDNGSELIATCSQNGDPRRLDVPLIQSIVKNAGREKVVIVNASLSLLAAGKGAAKLDRALIVSGTDNSASAETEAILRKLLAHNPRMQLGLIFIRSDDPQVVRQRFLHFSGVARSLGVRPLLRLGTLPDRPDIYSSILYRRPLVSSKWAHPELKLWLEEIAIDLLKILCSSPGKTCPVSYGG